MDKIELMTQPEKDSVSESPQERTLQKLKSFVSEYRPDTNDDDEEEKKEHEGTGKEKTGESDKNGNSHSHSKHSYDNVHQNDAKDVNKDSKETQEKTTHEEEGSVGYDDDGFAIPQGKIPLDGHFSTSEIKELLKLSKEGGILKDGVNVKVLDSNEKVGDKVVISEKTDKDKVDKGDQEGEDDSNGDKKVENGEKNKKDEKESRDSSNSIDPKEKAKQYGKKSESG